MSNHIVGLSAVHSVAKIAYDLKWFFREQHSGDYGIDGHIEMTSEDRRPNGRLVAVQIKGGGRGLHRTKKGFVFYFSFRHYSYWSSYTERMPMILIVQSPINKLFYWQRVSIYSMEPTETKYKIHIPFSNKFDASSRGKIQELVNSFKTPSTYADVPSLEDDEDDFFENRQTKKNAAEEHLAVRYCLDPANETQLHLLISDATQSAEINTRYKPERKNWNKEEGKLFREDPHYHTISQFKGYLNKRYVDIKSEGNPDVFGTLKDEVLKMIKRGGITEIARRMFDDRNKDLFIPTYDEFIRAFELHTGLKKRQFQVKVMDWSLRFETDKDTYEMDTYPGYRAFLKDTVGSRNYDGIFLMTNGEIWRQIAFGEELLKKEFVSKMLEEWEIYWDKDYEDVRRSVGDTKHLDEKKAASWMDMRSLIDNYSSGSNAITMAGELDDLVLYPLAVIAMMHYLNPDACVDEYCDREFNGEGGYEWEDIILNEGKDNEIPFFIKPVE